MTYLLDVNLLIALVWPRHVHHQLARDWFSRKGKRGWATCPLTEAGFVRISSNPMFVDGHVSPNEAARALREAMADTKHEFWPDDFSVSRWSEVPWRYCLSHRQVTDAYLVELAIRRKGKLATLDQGIKSLIPDAESRKSCLETVSA